MIDFKEYSELFHHGIKNMHWGVRNGPPYPLDKKTSARIKSGKNEKARISDKEYQEKRKKKMSNKERTGLTKYADAILSNVGTKLFREAESRLKEVINASDLPSRDLNVADIWQTNPDFMKRRKTNGYVDNTMLHDCNMDRQGYDKYSYMEWVSDEPGLNNNCIKCSNTLEMMKRGYDIQAGRSAYGMLGSATQYYWNGAVPYKEKGADNIMKRIEKFGHKGSGEINMRRPTGSGHSVYFQTEKTPYGYKTFFLDGQNGKKYDSIHSLIQAEGFDVTQFANITRLDNATPNFKHMAEDSVFRVNYSNKNLNAVSDKINNKYYTNVRWTG